MSMGAKFSLSKVPPEVLQNWVLIHVINMPHIFKNVQGLIKELILSCLVIGTGELVQAPCSLFTVYRLLVQAVLMTGSDLCASSKPWELQLQTVDAIYAEFYHQGDVELEAGRVPVPIMNRCFLDQRALHQVQKMLFEGQDIFSSTTRNM